MNLRENLPLNGDEPESWSFEDFIPRNSTASVMMVVGAVMPAGKVQPEKIAAHYKWLDSFVATSYKELFGIDVR